jgi:hypothetical protein
MEGQGVFYFTIIVSGSYEQCCSSGTDSLVAQQQDNFPAAKLDDRVCQFLPISPDLAYIIRSVHGIQCSGMQQVALSCWGADGVLLNLRLLSCIPWQILSPCLSLTLRKKSPPLKRTAKTAETRC